MSQQPDSQPDTAQPAGIDSQLDAGLADDDAQGQDADSRPAEGERTDPDDPEASIQQATERSRGED
jgi:hypothetical protein